MKTIRAFLYLLVASTFMLTGCGGGGGGGPAAAEISPSNVVDLAVAATEGLKSSATSSETPLPFKTGSGSSSPNTAINKLVGDITQNYYAVHDFSELCPGGGSAFLEDTTGVVTITACIISDGSINSITLNGTITIIISNSGTSTFTVNLTFNQNSITQSVNATGSCDAQINCTFTTSYTGIDGRTYTTANMNVTGDNSTGYSVSGTITDPDHGNITIATNTPVTFNCADGRPDNGIITVTGGSSATVEFIDCTSFAVTFDGSTIPYYWVDF